MSRQATGATVGVVAETWAQVLSLPEVQEQDNFLECGGHSLLATRVIARLRDRLGVVLTPDALLDSSSFAEFCELVEAAQPGTAIASPMADDGTRVVAPTQERLWFVNRLAPESPAYTVLTVERVHGPVSPEVLCDALLAVSQRHEVLRWTFPAVQGRPQVVVNPPAAPLRVDDLRHQPEPEKTAAAERILAEEAADPLDIEGTSVWRVRLVRLADDEQLIVFAVHHIAVDGWSIDVLYRDLAAAYGRAIAGAPADLPPLAYGYGDYASERRRELEADGYETELSYWRERLAGVPLVLDLPRDRARPTVQTYRGAEQSLVLSDQLTAGLHDLARSCGVTPFVPLLSAFGMLLGRLAGVDDLLVGTPVAGRSRTAHEELVGFFIDTVPVRIDLSGGPSGREVVRRVGESLRGALAHQELPFHRLVEELAPPRDPSRSPVVQVLFNGYTYADAQLCLPGTSSQTVDPPLTGSLFDLTVSADERGGELQLRLVYNPDLYDQSRMDALLTQYVRLLDSLVEQPAGLACAYHLTDIATPPAVAAAAPGSDDAPGLLDGLRSGIHRNVTAVAVVDGYRTLHYSELDLHAHRLTSALAAGGVEPGEVVAVWAGRTVALPVALLGILRAGAAFTVLDPAYPPARLARQLRSTRAAALVLADSAPLPDEVARVVAHLPVIDALAATAPAVAIDGPARSNGPAYVAFTSGTTGEPRGIVGGAAALSHFFDWYSRTFDLGSHDRFTVLSGLSHDPLLRDLLLAMWCGASAHLPDPALLVDPQRLRAWLVEVAPTVIHLTPQLARLITAGSAAGVLGSVKLLCLGGDTLTDADVVALRRLAPGARIVNGYGATETPQLASWSDVTDTPVPLHPAGPMPVPVGAGAPGAQLLVRNAAGAPAGIGELGEVWVRSAFLAEGYLHDADLSAERFTVGGYRTGDLGRHLPNGSVVLAGRADDQVKLRGFRVEPREVEAALLALPGVAHAAVVARDDMGGERTLVAYVVAAPGSVLHAEDLARTMRGVLPDAAVPAAYELLDRLPLTPNGKVDRSALLRPAQDRSALATALVPARSDLERTVAGVWQEILGVARVGVHDNFFDLGGNSLALVAAHTRLQELLGRKLPVTDLFRFPTVATLAAHIQHADARGSTLDHATARAKLRRARIVHRAAATRPMWRTA